jgi:hypothetical protein
VLNLTISTTGASAGAISYSSSATGFAANLKKWVRATLDVDTGASASLASFSSSDDGVTWSSLGTAAGAVASISTATSSLLRIGNALGDSQPLVGKLYYAEVRNGINGTIAAKYSADLSGQTGYTDTANSTPWTINRTTSGKKAALADRVGLLAGSDDYLEVPDHPALNFAAGEEFTVCALIRRFGTPASSQVIAAKKVNLTTSAGWSLHMDTSSQVVARVGDGSANISANTGALAAGALSFVALVRKGGQLYAHLNGTTSAGTADTVGSSVNAEVLRVGRLSGAGTNYADFEIFAFAVFRAGLNDSQLARVRVEMERA